MYYALPPIIAPIFTVQVVSSQSACSHGHPTNFCQPKKGLPCQAGRSSVQEASWQSYREYEEGNAHPKHLRGSSKSSPPATPPPSGYSRLAKNKDGANSFPTAKKRRRHGTYKLHPIVHARCRHAIDCRKTTGVCNSITTRWH